MNERNPYAPCPYACNNKSASGWCALTACINPKYNGSGTFIINKTEYSVVKNREYNELFYDDGADWLHPQMEKERRSIMAENMTEEYAIEVLDGYLWYGKIYEQKTIEEAWKFIRSMYFEHD